MMAFKALISNNLRLSCVYNHKTSLQYSSKLEKETFDGRTADFVFMLLLGAIPMLLAAYLLHIPILSMSLMSYLIYIWCNLNTNANLTLFFIPIQIPARYFPWALMAFHVLMGGSLFYDLIGIVAGHMYYFTMFYYPREYHKTLLNTPGFLLNLFPPQRMNVSGYTLNMNNNTAAANNNARPEANATGGGNGPYRWGQGRRLGA